MIFKYSDCIIAKNDATGISCTNQKLCVIERKKVLDNIYSLEEQKKLDIESKKFFNSMRFAQLRKNVLRG